MSVKVKQDESTDERIMDPRKTFAIIRRQKWLEQYDSIDTLAKSADPQADVVLFQLLDLRSPNVREKALNALADRSETLGRTAARAMSEDSQMRHVVINALREVIGPMEREQALHAIRTMLEIEENPGVRETARHALDEISVRTGNTQLCDPQIHASDLERIPVSGDLVSSALEE